MGHSNNNSKIIGALFLGGVIGATLGILFAPNKGNETREKLSLKSQDLMSDINRKFNTFMEEIKAEIEGLKVNETEKSNNSDSRKSV